MQGKRLTKVVAAMMMVMFIAGCSHMCKTGDRDNRVQQAGMGGK